MPTRTLVLAFGSLLALALIAPESRQREGGDASPPVAEIATGGSSRAVCVPNLGQWSHPAHFVLRTGVVTTFVEDRGWALDLPAPDSERDLGGVGLRMTFEGPRASR